MSAYTYIQYVCVCVSSGLGGREQRKPEMILSLIIMLLMQMLHR